MISYTSKMEIIKENLNKYLKVSKKEKGKILDELTDILNLSREQVISPAPLLIKTFCNIKYFLVSISKISIKF